MPVRGVEGIRTPDEGFADPCLTTWPRRHFKELSGRWDSNPRPSPWQGDVLPLYYARISWSMISDRECRDPGSNWGHRDFQSRALPTELSRPDIFLLSVRDFTRGYRDCQADFFKLDEEQRISLDLNLLPHYNLCLSVAKCHCEPAGSNLLIEWKIIYV